MPLLPLAQSTAPSITAERKVTVTVTGGMSVNDRIIVTYNNVTVRDLDATGDTETTIRGITASL